MIGRVYTPESSSLTTSTGVFAFSKFSEQFKEFGIQMAVEIMNHLELCLEINASKDTGTDEAIGDPTKTDTHLFFPGLIRVDTPERVLWDEPHSETAYHFGWILQCSQDSEFFDPRCFQVLILRIVHTLVLYQLLGWNHRKMAFCYVWKTGISWCSKNGATFHIELCDNGKSFSLKVRCQTLNINCLIFRSKIITNILQVVKDTAPWVMCLNQLLILNKLFLVN